jgi:hypothetical protein
MCNPSDWAHWKSLACNHGAIIFRLSLKIRHRRFHRRLKAVASADGEIEVDLPYGLSVMFFCHVVLGACVLA